MQLNAGADAAGACEAAATAAGSELSRWLMNTTASEPATRTTTTMAATNFWRWPRRLALEARRAC